MIEKKEAFDWEKFQKQGKAPDHIVSENPRKILVQLVTPVVQ